MGWHKDQAMSDDEDDDGLDCGSCIVDGFPKECSSCGEKLIHAHAADFGSRVPRCFCKSCGPKTPEELIQDDVLPADWTAVP